jgi:hypothetical protein
MQGQNKHEPKDLWQEPFVPASAWRPCADQFNWEASGDSLSLSLFLSLIKNMDLICKLIIQAGSHNALFVIL